MAASAFTAWANRCGTIEGPLEFESDAATVTLNATDHAGNFVSFTIDMADVPALLEYAANALHLAIAPVEGLAA